MTRLTLLLSILLLTLAACAGPSSGGPSLLPQCTNGIADPNEGGVDCGGPCPSCSLATCTNQQRDPNESDVDCGGPCADCPEGKACNGPTDCASGNCDQGFCASPAACDDGEKNGSETDLDCGGECAGCGAGRMCAGPSDCLSEVCEGGLCGEPASCKDGLKSPDESDVDCGGPCRACATGRFCDVDLDCLSVVCTNGVCRDPSCTDARKNQNETDVDCGGICPSCDDGKRCGAAADCASGKCSEGRCVSCSDGVKNGDESGVDCGGSCGPCQDGGSCSGDQDCATGKCDRGFCCVPNACGECAALPTEVCDGADNDCDGQTDEAGDIGVGPACDKNTGVCVGARATCRGEDGWTCNDSDYRAVSNQYEANESRCDGLDNDCDGSTDEGVTNACGTCGAAPTEVCDGADNDCDGSTDEGVTNACGRCGPVPDELCNGRDDDCDGQTDELAACAGCMSTPVVLEESTADSPPPLNTQSIVLLADQTPVLAYGGFSVELMRFGPSPSMLGNSIDGEAARVVRLGNDLLVVARQNQWWARRFNTSGVSQQTWSDLFPATFTVESLASSGSEALLFASGTNFGGGDNLTSFEERRLSGGTWSARAVVTEGWLAGRAVLSGSDAVRAYIYDEGASDRLRVKWGNGAATNLLESSHTSFQMMTAPDGRVHLVTEYEAQHWVGSNGTFTRTNIAGPALLGGSVGLATLPGGELAVLVSDSTSYKVAVLRDGRWTVTPLVNAVGEESLRTATFAIDSFGRLHLIYTGNVYRQGIEWSFVRGRTYCLPL